MRNYYSQKLSAERLRLCYEIAPPRVKRYLEAEIYFVLDRIKPFDLVFGAWLREGRGNFRKRGMGKALLRTAEEDVKARGAKGLVAWGLSLPFWMKAWWFRKQGYRKVDQQGLAVLLWKPFANDAVPPRWIRPKKAPETIPGTFTKEMTFSASC